MSFFKGHHKYLCLKVGRHTKKKKKKKKKSAKYVRSQMIVIITNRTNAGDVVVDHEMIQYEYSRNTAHVTLGFIRQSAARLTANPGIMSLCPSHDTYISRRLIKMTHDLISPFR